MSDQIERILTDTIRETRESTLALAIEICDELAKMGGCAGCCATALRNIKERLPRPSSKMS